MKICRHFHRKGEMAVATGKWIVIVFLLLMIFASCNGGKMSHAPSPLTSFDNIQDAAWNSLSTRKILFGHQSVGRNILNGIDDVMKEKTSIKLGIHKTQEPPSFSAPLFAHFDVGKNENPVSKVEHFAEIVGNGVGGKADIAFFKFCYVDIDEKTDVGKLFDTYRDRMRTLREESPGTTIVHVTVPLTVSKTSIKTWIKKITGWGDLWEYKANVKRNEFNEMMLKEYGGKEPLFDLAAAEATRPDGTKAVFTLRGKSYNSLVPEYSKDGGHLNELGRTTIAKQLLSFLASLPDGSR